MVCFVDVWRVLRIDGKDTVGCAGSRTPAFYWLRIDGKDTVGCAGSRTPQKFSRYGVVWVMGIRWEYMVSRVCVARMIHKTGFCDVSCAIPEA